MQDVHLLQRGFSKLLYLLGAEAASASDVNDLHGVFLARGLVDAAPDHTANSPGGAEHRWPQGPLTGRRVLSRDVLPLSSDLPFSPAPCISLRGTMG